MTREQIEALMKLEKKATAREWSRVCNVFTGLWCIGRIEEHTAKQLGGSADSELACELRNAAPDLFRLALRGLAAEKVVEAARVYIVALEMEVEAWRKAETTNKRDWDGVRAAVKATYDARAAVEKEIT